MVNFNTRDLAAWAAFTGVSVPVGFFAGAHSALVVSYAPARVLCALHVTWH